MKRKKTFNTIVEEVIANGIGWIAGLASVDLLGEFFIVKKWYNLGGIFSKRTAIDSDTFSFLEWTLTAVIGFVVMIVINKFIRKKLFKKKLDESKLEEIQSEEHVISTVYEENPAKVQGGEQITTENEKADLNTETDIPPKIE